MAPWRMARRVISRITDSVNLRMRWLRKRARRTVAEVDTFREYEKWRREVKRGPRTSLPLVIIRELSVELPHFVWPSDTRKNHPASPIYLLVSRYCYVLKYTYIYKGGTIVELSDPRIIDVLLAGLASSRRFTP